MDRSCNVVPYSRDFRNLPSSCTFSVSYFESSPISLILDQDSWNDRESTLTKFPLNPADTNSWYTWKASDKAPLLVYDPEHTGKINRAAQLFGEWTFGGQRYAALGSENVRPTPWKDGYEALATLDSNGDEKISGQELTPLALWLDANRDGISQSGEVQPVGDFGITALYFRADRKDEITNSIYASVGYERMINNQKVIGSSVDWYGKAASSPMSFLDQPMSLGIKGEAENTNSALPTIHQDSTDALPESAALASGETAGGLWQWNFDDRKDQNSGGSSGGLLLIRDNASGKKIKGISFVQRELIVSDKVRDDRALGSVNLIEGLKKFDKNGRPVLLFKTIEGGERAKVTSEAVINSDGTMSGTSSAKVAGQSLTYRWTAKRVEKK